MNDFETIDTNHMANVTGGGIGGALVKGAKWVGKNWQGLVSAADLAYNAGKDLLGGGKKEAPAQPAK